MNISTVFEGLYNETFVKYSKDNHVIFSISFLMSLVATFTVFSNCTLFIAMVQTLVKDYWRGLRTVANNSHNSFITMFLMLSMTLSGVMVGGFIMPLSILELISNGRWTYGYSLCAVKVYTDYLLCAVSTLHVLFMAVDTYVLVCKPLAYRQLKARTAYAMISSGWILPIVLAVLWSTLQKVQLADCIDASFVCQQFSNAAIFNFIFATLFFILYSIVIVLYLLIMNNIIAFRKRKYQRTNKNIKTSICMQNISQKLNQDLNVCSTITATLSIHDSQSISMQTSPSEVSIQTSEVSMQTAEVSSSKKVRTNTKCFRFIGMIINTFSICWIPSWIVFLLCSSCTLCLTDLESLFFDWLTYVSCTVNPILYCSNKSIRKSVKHVLCSSRKTKHAS
jgi:7 transmembrane receptor (rhodopsin family)